MTEKWNIGHPKNFLRPFIIFDNYLTYLHRWRLLSLTLFFFNILNYCACIALTEVWAFGYVSNMSHSTHHYLVAPQNSMEIPAQKGIYVNTKSDCEMWERGVFGSPHHVCSITKDCVFGWGNAHIVGSGDRGYGPARGPAASLRQTTRWRSANIAVNSTSWSPWQSGSVYLKIPEPEVTLRYCP